MEISVIIAVFNDEATIIKTLEALARLQNVSEIVLVDGGSTDETIKLVENFKQTKNLQLIKSGVNNRGFQLHEGAGRARGDVFWFLNSDMRPVQGSGRQIKALMRFKEVVGGNFDVVFEGKSRWARFLTRLYRHLRASNMLYGDSAIFVRRETYEKIKGFKSLPIFEDVDLAKRIRRRGRFMHVNLAVTVSAQRFENRRFLLAFVKWSLLQGFYWVGVPPSFLAKGYRQIR